MKRFILPVLGACLVLFVSCSRDPEIKHPNADKILGKWRLQKAVEEEYRPINTLISTDTYPGEPGDSVVFKANGVVVSYSDTDGMDEFEYHFVNNNTISMDDEEYKIGVLTDTEFQLYEEEKDLAANEKWIYKVFLVR